MYIVNEDEGKVLLCGVCWEVPQARLRRDQELGERGSSIRSPVMTACLRFTRSVGSCCTSARSQLHSGIMS